jgi:hypothetical protein
MKSLFYLTTVLAATGPLAGHAQTAPAARHATVFDLTGASGPSLNAASAATWRLWGLDAAGRFQVGLGLRATQFFAAGYALDRQTGPAGGEIQVAQPRLTAFNVAFHLRARVVRSLHLGFNLDALGLSVGPNRVGQAAGSGAILSLRPVAGNVLLGGRADRGSLNSELYAAWGLTQGLQLRGGYSHLVTAYEDDASRYHRFLNLAVLGLSYQLP